MDLTFNLTPPFFELGPKAYAYGKQVLELALFADGLSAQYDVPIIMTPQYVDIRPIAQATSNLLVFAQHVDPLCMGRGNGSVLPEAIKEAGAVGTMLNHSEKPLSMDVLSESVARAYEIGLASMVCARDQNEVETVARMHPNIIIVETPELIGAGSTAPENRPSISGINQLVWAIDPAIRILHAAGISTGKDVYEIIAAGSQGSGSSSGVFQAEDPPAMLEEMIQAVRRAWDDTHQSREG
jgi:triosephosphate isomerase